MSSKKFVFRRAALYRRVFETPDGQRVLADILANCGVLDPVISGTTESTLVAAGKQSAGLEILGILKKDPAEVWSLMEGNSYEQESERVDQVQVDDI